ncbi:MULTISPECIES: helix-turn-helix domain-containing protein [unclassified Streptomyces]|uniref:helix-turn-helix domain-containing protein n=1 Tax=unclassified Streptomyces TaxID=2593676 RepID=UPI0036EB58DB
MDNYRDIASTAAALGVHPNTGRYRVERIQATFGLDLADLDTFTWLVSTAATFRARPQGPGLRTEGRPAGVDRRDRRQPGRERTATAGAAHWRPCANP